MTWFKVDDGFWSHPKSAPLSNDAVALWVRAGAYCCQHLTDGFVKASVLRMLGERESADELVDSGLWRDVTGGWRFHDWDEYQETSETVKKRREDARDRQRKAREARESKRRMSQGESQRESHVTDGVTDSVSHGVSSLPPTRPDPTRPEVTPSGVTSSSSVADRAPLLAENDDEPERPMTLIPDDWAPNDLHRARNPRPDLNEIAEAFRDHAISRGRRCHGRAGWDAAFSTWLRKSDPPTKPGMGSASSKAQGWLDLANHLPDDTDEQKAIGQ